MHESLKPLAIEIDKLNADPANPRTRDEEAVDAIAESLSTFGQRVPLVVQKKGMIVRAGNGRLAAMKKLGWTHAACIVVDEDDAEAAAFGLADNYTAELATWDYSKLVDELKAMDTPPPGITPEQVAELADARWSREEHERTGAEKPPTLVIAVDGVTAEDKDALLARVNEALEGTDYSAAAF